MNLKLSSFTILIVFGCLSIIGLSIIPLLNVKLKPTREYSSISINYSWRNSSAKLLEKEVTSKLEGVFNVLQGVRNINSLTQKGRGRITLEFEKNSDMDAKRFEISNLIRQTYDDLPLGVSYPQINNLNSFRNNDEEKAVLSYSINSLENPYYIEKYVRDKLIPKLKEIDGVNSVNIYGANSYEWVVEYKTNQLLQLGISVFTISRAVNLYFQKQQLGLVSFYSNEDSINKEISLSLIYNSTEEVDWSSIPVKKVGERIIYLSDISDVKFKETEPTSYYRVNGLNAISITIFSDKGINTIDLSKKVKTKVSNLNDNLNQDGYSLKLTYDSSEFISEEISKIISRSAYSLIILLILILFIHWNFNYLKVLFLSIVANLTISIIFYYLFKVELQIYSFAGITISFGIIVDNSIVMIDHIRNKGNKRVFLAIIASTLTTIGALFIIFFLKEEQKINLLDFALVISINIIVSLFISFFLIPSLLEKVQLKRVKFNLNKKRLIVKFTKVYIQIILLCKKKYLKWFFILIFIFGFGLPLHLLPEKLKGDSFFIEFYNNTLGNDWFNKEIRKDLEKFIGGSIRLFTENIFEKSYNLDPEVTAIKIRGNMPPGVTISQLNESIKEFENLLSKYSEVKLFETNVFDSRNSQIQIYFTKNSELTGFPYVLKKLLEEKANSLGAASWSVAGIGRGFSNALGSGYKSQAITLEGYNYSQLYGYAEELKEQLIRNAGVRIKDITIQNNRRSYKQFGEFYLDLDSEKLADAEISQSIVQSFLRNIFFSEGITTIVNDSELQTVRLVSDEYKKSNIWDFKSTPLWISKKQYKLGQLAILNKKNINNSIYKTNQQYSLIVSYDFIGTYRLARKVKRDNIKQIKTKLPIGFKVGKSFSTNWDKDGVNQYYSLIIVIFIIFLVCAVLLESLKQPFVIISMIPISFIGVFLTFYLFDFNFDQGGYASFILLCGISVNSALYIINDFNNLKTQYPKRNLTQLYFKAFNYKIIPVSLTIVSTIVGLIPFIWSEQNEAFWFSFAVGAIGGLIFSTLGIFLYLPLFLKMDKK